MGLWSIRQDRHVLQRASNPGKGFAVAGGTASKIRATVDRPRRGQRACLLARSAGVAIRCLVAFKVTKFIMAQEKQTAVLKLLASNSSQANKPNSDVVLVAGNCMHMCIVESYKLLLA